MLQEKAYDFLKELIKGGLLKQDELYSETKMASEIGISRTPFKAALIRLSQDRYIDIIPSKGFMLHKLSERDIWETFQVRSAIESYCAIELLHSRDTERGKKYIDEMTATASKMARAQLPVSVSENLYNFLALDMRFHITLVSSAENRTFDSVYNTYQFQISKLATTCLLEDGQARRTLLEHQKILVAIQQGTVNDCLNAVEEHLSIAHNINLHKMPG